MLEERARLYSETTVVKHQRHQLQGQELNSTPRKIIDINPMLGIRLTLVPRVNPTWS